MKKSTLARHASLLVISAALFVPAAMAQNVAIVNGKPVPKSRVEALLAQATRPGQQGSQPRTAELEAQVRDEVVLREMFMQEAEKRGLTGSADYKQQLELARQSILIRELFNDYQKKNPVLDADVQAEYEKFKAQASGTEYHARHILVEKEEDAKALIAQIKGGAKFEDLAKKNSKDPGSGENGGDLDWANPGSYVPEFSQAMIKLKKGEMTPEPVKTQFGYHIIKLEDTRDAQFPPLEEVKPQILQRLGQQKLAKFRDEIRAKAKTDYKFSTAN
ncbi:MULTISPECIES: peptidylprolyl isomerase [unclassified Rhizobacter]|uniref:peptidylprolyl isomerase n=1 Tax=unclassified Rhizobacter TaxID=2640088 RepID=UPI0006FE7D5F|nr:MULTISPECIES: peptidylprolyl isomerase [unclassified Rhizobacter]KQU81569.1 peptidylprolyl isomerase [Rhizobacter sp. Root29]KQW12101.1 peptidylprolyl isomerase [Rhizobacter sp. Root1238]KRB02916.1 peptidylprolyl isomerase [Rhizobacter sp. Root16D2]